MAVITQESFDALTAAHTDLTATCTALKLSVVGQISDAVAASRNAALNPLIIAATATINLQTMFVNFITISH